MPARRRTKLNSKKQVRKGTSVEQQSPRKSRTRLPIAPDENAVPSIRLPDGSTFELDLPRSMKADAMRWAYIARNRRRWRGVDPATDDPFGGQLSRKVLQTIAQADVVEISIPFLREDVGWEVRIFPWEYVLSKLTKPFRDPNQKQVVVRHLDIGDGDSAARPVLPGRVSIVESVPGRLADEFDLGGERMLMTDSLGDTDVEVRSVKDPTRSQLEQHIQEYAPHLIHLAGADTHETVELLKLEIDEAAIDEARVLDGMALRAEHGSDPDLVDGKDLAKLLTAAASKPELVSFNFYNSAPRLAPLALLAGARAAIGFQDTIDNSLAEQFFAALYRGLAQRRIALVDAFRDAFASIRRLPIELKGACIVLWTRHSIADRRAKQPQVSAAPATTLMAVEKVPAAERIHVECLPIKEVNYSLLHNGRSLFQKLQIARRRVVGRIADIRLEVTLYVGQESFPFVTTLLLEEDDVALNLADRVVVPLTSSLIRTQCERIQSTLQVRVTCDSTTVTQETHRITLTPVDEWTDNDSNRLWLPSFVLPRDVAVARIIDSAQRYLMAIADDPAAGFDGYQSIDESASTIEERYGPVDLQVQAIWSALLYEHRLSYVNPPPSYGTGTQRLRIPTNILLEGRGTCIDLALLLAACLEYVDIYPVLFLLEEHAFPGYWRSDKHHEDFRHLRGTEVPIPMTGSNLMRAGGTSERNQTGYKLDAESYFEVRDLVTKGHLVPLETVWLTNYSSFGEALEEGTKNLRSRREFQSMLDIVLAREEGVTPLPILTGAP